MARGGIDLALQEILRFHYRRLGGHEPEDYPPSLGQVRKRREIAGPLGVVGKAVDGGAEPVDGRRGDRLVAGAGQAGALEVGAAKVQRRRPGGGPAGEAFVDEPRMALGELVSILAARRELLARLRVAIAG